MLDFTDWPSKTWTIDRTQGKAGTGKKDVIQFQYDSATKKLTISGFTCKHLGAHGSFWQGVECLGDKNKATGTTKNSGTPFSLVCSDNPDGTHKLVCAIASDLSPLSELPTQLSEGVAVGTPCWTANDGGKH